MAKPRTLPPEPKPQTPAVAFEILYSQRNEWASAKQKGLHHA